MSLVRKQNFSATRDLGINFRCFQLEKFTLKTSTRISPQVFAENPGTLFGPIANVV